MDLMPSNTANRNPLLLKLDNFSKVDKLKYKNITSVISMISWVWVDLTFVSPDI